MSKLKFKELPLSKELLKATSDMGFEYATPIQEAAIPEVLAGHDVIGQASTGTGKTAAFAIPLIDKLDPEIRSIQSIILCPTRELAIQVAGEIHKFLKYKKGFSVVAVYGGQPIHKQFSALRRDPQIIVGTPGRTLDHIKRGTIYLGNAKFAVLDEADEMLDMGFREDIEQILQETNKERQTLLFSATMPKEVLSLTKKFQKDPKHVKVAKEKNKDVVVEQVYYEAASREKTDHLITLLAQYKPKLAVVFCNTKRMVDDLYLELKSYGFFAAGLHGDIRQSKRDSIMKRFRSGRVNILIATDVAARGIDVANVEVVFNYDIPREIESYVHRIGRTGRAGKSGLAISFVARRDMEQFRRIQKYANVNVVKQKLDLPKDERRSKKDSKSGKHEIKGFLDKKASAVFNKIRKTIRKEELSQYLEVMESIMKEGHSSKDVAAALFKMVVDVD